MSQTNDPVIRYAEIKAEIARLNSEAEELQPTVMAKVRELAGDDLKPVDTHLGTFIIARKKTWTYSPTHETMVKAVKDLEAKEQATGDATFEVQEQLRFTAAK